MNLAREFQEFANVDELDILKLCQTRWPSLLREIKRVRGSCPALAVYFASREDGDKPGVVFVYSSTILKPHLQKDINTRDNVMNNSPLCKYDYNYETTVTCMVQELGWSNLDGRRKTVRPSITHFQNRPQSKSQSRPETFQYLRTVEHGHR